MTQLRKSFRYILPLSVVGLLFSIVVSVFGIDYPNSYIGTITSELNTTDQTEKLTLNLFSDRNLAPASFVKAVRIYIGGPYGTPRGLVATAISAQAQRKKVNVATEFLVSLSDPYRVVTINQADFPDDILGMFDGLRLSDINMRISGLSTELDNQLISLNGIVTKNTNINTTVVISDNLVRDQTTGGSASLNNIYSQTLDIYGRANNVYTEVVAQRPTITVINATFDSLYSLTDRVNNQTLGLDTNVTAVDLHIRSVSDSINSKLNLKDTYLRSIWQYVQ